MAGAGARATVLVAATDPAVREVLARIVEADGHEVVRVAEPERVGGAVVTAAADALVLDLGAENLAALTELRGHAEPAAAAVRVVVLSTGPANARLAWQAGADVVLTRPFAATALQAELTAALGRAEADRAATRVAAAASLAV